MKLDRVKIEKFKRVEAVELQLSPLNVLVGTNGSGKSSIIQAVHLASCLIRQADRLREDNTSTVGVNELDYLPSNEYPELGYGTKWGNKRGTPSSKVTFTFKSDDEVQSAWVEFRSARNAGISVTGNVAQKSLVSILRTKNRFFSAYIPGVSGIPNQEQKQSRRVVLRACSYGDSNVYLRHVLNLLKDESGSIQKIESWLSEVIGPVRILVRHEEAHDLTIEARIEIDGKSHPIELIGAGFLQLIQIFSYILLFRPKILLIDEPDIHLHPNVQEKVPGVFSRVAEDLGMKILMTTHSPFIVRGAPVNANVYWVKDGGIEYGTRQAVELALGWGAFGKKILIISEDTDTSFLRKLIMQWPEIDKYIAFYPGHGFKNLPTPGQAKEVHEALCGKYQVLVHRDRDSLTNDEVVQLETQYTDQGVHLWFPEFSDIEAYFCQSTFLQEIIGCTEGVANEYIEDVLAQTQVIQDQFNKQRKSHNEEIYKEGGSPTNDEVWGQCQARPLRGAKGKYVFNQLKNKIPGNAFHADAVLNHSLNGGIALKLKTKLEELLAD